MKTSQSTDAEKRSLAQPGNLPFTGLGFDMRALVRDTPRQDASRRDADRRPASVRLVPVTG